jgi:hypothetical protein
VLIRGRGQCHSAVDVDVGDFGVDFGSVVARDHFVYTIGGDFAWNGEGVGQGGRSQSLVEDCPTHDFSWGREMR